MAKKATIAYIIFTIILCYIISPWILERTLFLNELLSFIGLVLLLRNKLKIGNDPISISIVLLIAWCGLHLITSLFRMDGIYYYLRNSVIVYSIFGYFIGYYCLAYLPGYFHKLIPYFKYYILVFLIFPSYVFFERFGMATVFPALFIKKVTRRSLLLLILLSIIYGIVYSSSTVMILVAFYIVIAIVSSYRIFKWGCLAAFVGATATFIYFIPYFDLIERYNPYYYYRIYDVMNSHPLLAMDHNSSWRLIFWKQILVDHFPENLIGLGLGTPAIRYFPVEDFKKIDSLPYVFGAHNSFVYLFGRLGLPYVLFLIAIYRYVFREYFYFKPIYYKNKAILLFWSFFAVSVISFFNPVLESPIYASLYWIILGFLARAIHTRRTLALNKPI